MLASGPPEEGGGVGVGQRGYPTPKSIIYSLGGAAGGGRAQRYITTIIERKKDRKKERKKERTPGRLYM